MIVREISSYIHINIRKKRIVVFFNIFNIIKIKNEFEITIETQIDI